MFFKDEEKEAEWKGWGIEDKPEKKWYPGRQVKKVI